MNIKRVPCAPDATPARLPHYSTVRAHHRTWAPSRAAVSHTLHNTLRMHDTMVVKGWSVGSLLSESLGGSDAQLSMRTWRVPKGRWIIALLLENVSHALRCLCEGLRLLSPCY